MDICPDASGQPLEEERGEDGHERIAHREVHGALGGRGVELCFTRHHALDGPELGREGRAQRLGARGRHYPVTDADEQRLAEQRALLGEGMAQCNVIAPGEKISIWLRIPNESPRPSGPV